MDVVVIIFEYLGPQDLILISFTCKELMERLTYDHVLRSSLYRGNATHRTSLESIVTICRSGKIYIPSPVRLLRLMNGRRCELPSCPYAQKIKYTSENFGLHICFDCIKTKTAGLNFNTKRDRAWKPIVDHVRCASSDYSSRSFIWFNDYSHAGERSGPIITAQLINRLRAIPNTSISDSLQSYLNSIPIGPQLFFDIYDTVLPESNVYHEGVAKRKFETSIRNKDDKLKKYEEIEVKLIQMIPEAPWKTYITDSVYVKALLEPYRKAPSKATKKALQAIVDNVRPKFDKLFEFVKLEFLIDSNQSIISQIQSSSSQIKSSNSQANASANSLTNSEIDAFNESVILTTEDSYEISLKKHFNQLFKNNGLFTSITEKNLNLVFNSHFHEALIEIMTVASIATVFSRYVEQNEGHQGLAFSLYHYLCSQKEYHSTSRSILDSIDEYIYEDGRERFNLLKSVYYEAKSQYPALLANSLEYYAFGQDKIEKQTFTCGQFAIDRWNRYLNNEMNKIWYTRNFGVNAWDTRQASGYIKMLIDKSYPLLYNIHRDLANQEEWRVCQ